VRRPEILFLTPTQFRRLVDFVNNSVVRNKNFMQSMYC